MPLPHDKPSPTAIELLKLWPHRVVWQHYQNLPQDRLQGLHAALATEFDALITHPWLSTQGILDDLLAHLLVVGGKPKPVVRGLRKAIVRDGSIEHLAMPPSVLDGPTREFVRAGLMTCVEQPGTAEFIANIVRHARRLPEGEQNVMQLNWPGEGSLHWRRECMVPRALFELRDRWTMGMGFISTMITAQTNFGLDISKVDFEPNKDLLQEVARFRTAQTQAWALWNSHRVVLRLDHSLSQMLADSDPASQVPGTVLSRLPYPAVCIVPGDVNVDGHRIDCIVAALDSMLVETPAEIPELGFSVFVYHDGQEMPLAMGPAPCSTLSIDQIVRDAIGHISPVLRSNSSWEGRAFAFATQALLYLCAEEPDIARLPPGWQVTDPLVYLRSRRQLPKPQIVEIGARVGAAFRLAQQQRASATAADTGRGVTPHWRRAHFHLYWTGPGRTVPRVRWVSAVPVSSEIGDRLSVTTRDVPHDEPPAEPHS